MRLPPTPSAPAPAYAPSAPTYAPSAPVASAPPPAYAPAAQAEPAYAPAAADDGLDDLLADLDHEPMPTRPAPVEDSGWMASASSLVGAVVSSVSGSDGVAAAEPEMAAVTTSGFGSSVAPSAPAAAPVAPAAAPVATTPGPGAAYMPAPVATTPGPGAAYMPAPVAAPTAPVAAAPVAAVAPMAPVAPPAPAAPVPPPCYGELCGDDAALGYVDDGQGMDLLADSSDDWSIDVRDADVAGQFAAVGGADDEGLGELDALDSMVVEVRTSTPGIEVEIDGKYVGVTPLLVDVGSGYHAVKLTVGDASQRFELQPQSDPDAWCFDVKGKSIKLDRCR